MRTYILNVTGITMGGDLLQMDMVSKVWAYGTQTLSERLGAKASSLQLCLLWTYANSLTSQRESILLPHEDPNLWNHRG